MQNIDVIYKYRTFWRDKASNIVEDERMLCKRVRKYLSEYLDDETTPSLKKEVKIHLNGCPDCQKALKDLKQTVSLVNSLNKVEIPPIPLNLLTRIHSNLPQKRVSRLWLISALCKSVKEIDCAHKKRAED